MSLLSFLSLYYLFDATSLAKTRQTFLMMRVLEIEWFIQGESMFVC